MEILRGTFQKDIFSYEHIVRMLLFLPKVENFVWHLREGYKVFCIKNDLLHNFHVLLPTFVEK